MRSQLRRPWLAVIMLVLLSAITATTLANADSKKADLPGPPICKGHLIKAPEFKGFSEDVWDEEHWDRKAPDASTIDSYHKKLRCAASNGHRHAMKEKWGDDKVSFYKHRGAMLFIQRVTPYYGCTKLGICKWWAIPVYIVSCESGGDYSAQNSSSSARGAYQMLDSTYATYCVACDWSVRDQDKAARSLYEEQGGSPWECA